VTEGLHLLHYLAMPLYLTRHGQTDWNLQRRWQSRTDTPLNDTGYRQAGAMQRELRRRGLTFSRVICSPLNRAQETTRIILDGSTNTVETNAALLEINLGDYEGRFEADLREEIGPAYDQWRKTRHREAAPGGESIYDVAARICPVLESVRNETGAVLIVAHGGVHMAIKAELSQCFSVDCLDDFHQDNNQIDVWVTDPPMRHERIEVEA
jgi:probable phosphoglycerate mutase